MQMKCKQNYEKNVYQNITSEERQIYDNQIKQWA